MWSFSIYDEMHVITIISKKIDHISGCQTAHERRPEEEEDKKDHWVCSNVSVLPDGKSIQCHVPLFSAVVITLAIIGYYINKSRVDSEQFQTDNSAKRTQVYS